MGGGGANTPEEANMPHNTYQCVSPNNVSNTLYHRLSNNRPHGLAINLSNGLSNCLFHCLSTCLANRISNSQPLSLHKTLHLPLQKSLRQHIKLSAINSLPRPSLRLCLNAAAPRAPFYSAH